MADHEASGVNEAGDREPLYENDDAVEAIDDEPQMNDADDTERLLSDRNNGAGATQRSTEPLFNGWAAFAVFSGGVEATIASNAVKTSLMGPRFGLSERVAGAIAIAVAGGLFVSTITTEGLAVSKEFPLALQRAKVLFGMAESNDAVIHTPAQKWGRRTAGVITAGMLLYFMGTIFALSSTEIYEFLGAWEKIPKEARMAIAGVFSIADLVSDTFLNMPDTIRGLQELGGTIAARDTNRMADYAKWLRQHWYTILPTTVLALGGVIGGTSRAGLKLEEVLSQYIAADIARKLGITATAVVGGNVWIKATISGNESLMHMIELAGKKRGSAESFLQGDEETGEVAPVARPLFFEHRCSPRIFMLSAFSVLFWAVALSIVAFDGFGRMISNAEGGVTTLKAYGVSLSPEAERWTGNVLALFTAALTLLFWGANTFRVSRKLISHVWQTPIAQPATGNVDDPLSFAQRILTCGKTPR